MKKFVKISVIIPISANETEHQDLIASLPNDWEIILSQENGRAKSLNEGARKATGDYLWFLHADSRLSENTIDALLNTIKHHPNALIYFVLAFIKGSKKPMWVNELGAKFRSNILGIPFGDQGFCIRKELFKRIGGFPEHIAYGEDHLFVWQTRQQRIKLRSTGVKLHTSARKYQEHRWLKTTVTHQYLWIKQAISEWIKRLTS